MPLPQMTTRQLMALVVAVAVVLAEVLEFLRLPARQQDILGGALILMAVPLSPLLVFLVIAIASALAGRTRPPK